jgi:hypothetical protein
MTIKRLVTGGNIKKDGPTFPVELHLKAVGALTLHTGVRDRRMKHTGAESALYEKWQVPLPSVWSSLQMYKKSA